MADELFILSELHINASTFGCMGIRGGLSVVRVSTSSPLSASAMSRQQLSAPPSACGRLGLLSGLQDQSHSSCCGLELRHIYLDCHHTCPACAGSAAPVPQTPKRRVCDATVRGCSFDLT